MADAFLRIENEAYTRAKEEFMEMNQMAAEAQSSSDSETKTKCKGKGCPLE